MVRHCAHCGAGCDYLQAGLDSFHCLSCGHLTFTDGTPIPAEPIFDGGFDPSALRPT
jgi:hypothetical protein